VALTLAVLGQLDVRFAGAGVPLPAKAQALLVYLAFAERPVRREFLADMFWGETGEGGARANLRMALSRLRQALPGLIAADAQTVSLQPELVEHVDAVTLLRTTMSTPRQPTPALEAAIDHYRGPFLRDFVLRDCAGFEDWVTAQRVRIDRHAVAVLQELAQTARQGGDTDQERACLDRWADIEPWNEEVVLPLMRLLGAAGATVAALDRFEACRKALAEEMGTRPSAALTQLGEQLRRGDPGPAPAVTGTDAPAPARAAFPPDTADALYGREGDVDLVLTQVRKGARLVILLGPAGIGKTRLAQAVTRELAGRYQDGQVLCTFDFMASSDTDQVSQDHFVRVLGSALSLDLTQTTQPLAVLKGYLAPRRMILGLDGFEAIIQAAPVVMELQQAAPHCLLLVTTRTRLAVASGWTHEVQGLAAPPGQGSRDPALNLLLDCARRAGVRLQDVHGDGGLDRLMRLLDGSPLAIQFAAQSLRVLSPTQLVEKLESGAWPVASLNVPGYRFSTLRDVMAGIWGQLDGELQAAWAACALFKGAFALDWAQDCAGVSDTEAVRLMEHSVLGRDTPGRLRMHELTRQYGLSMLEAMPDAARRKRAFAGAALQRLVAQAPALVREDAAAALDMLRPNIATLAAAFDMALEWSSPEEIHPPLRALHSAYHRLGWYHAATLMMDAVLTRHPQAPVAWRIVWHQMAGAIIHNQYSYHLESGHFHRAVALGGVRLPAPGSGGWRFIAYGVAAFARAAFTRPAAQALDRDAQRMLTQAVLMVALSRYVDGAPVAEMFAVMAAAMLAARRSGSPEARLSMLNKFAAFEGVPERFWRRPGVYDAYVRHITSVMQTCDPIHEAYMLRHLAIAATTLGAWDRVDTHLRRASSIMQALGYGYDQLECHVQLNMVLGHIGDFPRMLDGIQAREQEARRIEQVTIVRWMLILKLQALLRTDAANTAAAAECLYEIHTIPARRTRSEQMRVAANEALLMANQGDASGVLTRAEDMLLLARNMGARFFVLSPLSIMVDAVIAVATSGPMASERASRLVREMAAAYARLTKRAGAFAPRRLLYKGMAAALGGNVVLAQRFWREGLASCATDTLRYDRARLYWMLSLYAPESDAGDLASEAARLFDYCGVMGPPYPLLPTRRMDA